MTLDRLSHISQRMATLTLCLLIAILLINTTTWIFPNAITGEGSGFVFSFSNELSNLSVDVHTLPWWQIIGGIFLSSVPLLALALGLNHLRLLFKTYGQRAYFSHAAAMHLGKMGQYVAIWTILDLLCEPLLSYWLTMQDQHVVTMGVDSGDLVALFLAACITIIAQILKQASQLHSENQQFV